MLIKKCSLLREERLHMFNFKELLKKIKKNFLLISFALVTAIFAVYTITSAVEDNSGESADAASNATDSAEQKLTTEEIDKIIEDLKVSGNIDNIIDKLDEIIERAKLSGNDALQEYATNMKSAYELQKQLDSVKSLIEASKKKNSDIAAVDEQVAKIISVTTIVEDLRGAVSDEALLVLQSLSEDDLKKMQDLFVEINDLFDLNDISSLTVQQRSLLDIILLSRILDEDMAKDEKLQTAKEALSIAVTILESYQKQNYDDASYDALTAGSDEFLQMGSKASTVLPEQVVFLDGYFNMTHPPIMYDGHILLAIDDLYQYIDADIEYMYNNANMVIKSPDKILEITSGKNVGYINDTPKNMPVPILNFKNTIYMPVEFFAECYDISYKYIPDQECLILYHNLVQLSNPSVPNQLNKE